MENFEYLSLLIILISGVLGAYLEYKDRLTLPGAWVLGIISGMLSSLFLLGDIML